MKAKTIGILRKIQKAEYPQVFLKQKLKNIDSEFGFVNIDGLIEKVENKLTVAKLSTMCSALEDILLRVDYNQKEQSLLSKYLDEFHKRQYPLKLFKKILEEKGIDTTFIGYKGLQTKVHSFYGEQLEDMLEAVEKTYLRFITYNKKMCFFYRVSEEDKQSFSEMLRNIVDKDGEIYREYIKDYPLSIGEKELIDIPTKESIAFLRMNERVALSKDILVSSCSKKYYKASDELPVTALSEEYRKDYETIRAMRHGYIQAFEFMSFDLTNNILQLYIDISPKIVVSDTVDYVQRIFLPKLKNLFKTNFSRELNLEPVSLFNKMGDLYSEQDGLVYSLHHITPSGSPKQEKMAKKTEDLRTEDFHAGGQIAIEHKTQIYRIYKIYNLDKSGEFVALEIPGDSKSIYGVDNLNYAIYHECTEEKHVNFLTNKLLS